MRITVFTPTYNRGYIIENLYHSLQRQSFKDFEWIVVDDGSTDNTEQLFDAWHRGKNAFPIRYQKVQNGGKHRAINIGTKLAEGELFFIVDSDDYLTDDALEKIDRVDRTIPNNTKSRFAGVCGNKGYSIDKPVGTVQDETGFLDITMLERPKYNITGDKAEVFYTEIMRKYPFPEFDGENFITEAVVWDRIAHDGLKLRFFNEVIYICDYLPDGLSAHSCEHFHNSPKGWGLYLYQSALYSKITGLEKWKQFANYYNTFKHELPFREIAENLHQNPVPFFIELFTFRACRKLKRLIKWSR